MIIYYDLSIKGIFSNKNTKIQKQSMYLIIY